MKKFICGKLIYSHLITSSCVLCCWLAIEWHRGLARCLLYRNFLFKPCINLFTNIFSCILHYLGTISWWVLNYSRASYAFLSTFTVIQGFPWAKMTVIFYHAAAKHWQHVWASEPVEWCSDVSIIMWPVFKKPGLAKSALTVLTVLYVPASSWLNSFHVLWTVH